MHMCTSNEVHFIRLLFAWCTAKYNNSTMELNSSNHNVRREWREREINREAENVKCLKNNYE